MRSKIIIPNLIAVLIVGLGGYFFLKDSLTAELVRDMDRQLALKQQIFERAERYRAVELQNRVSEMAASDEASRAFAKLELATFEGESPKNYNLRKRQEWVRRVYQIIETYSKMWQEATGRRPGFIFVTDSTGNVIARNTTPNACPAGYNVAEALPVVAAALSGKAGYQVWSVDDSPFSATKAQKDQCQLMRKGLLEVAAAPVYPEGDVGLDENIAGTVVVGLELSNGTARNKAAILDNDYALFKDNEVVSSSFENDTQRQALSAQLADAATAPFVNAALDGNIPSALFQIAVDGNYYHAIASPMYRAQGSDRISYIILASVNAATKPLDALFIFLGIMGLSIVLVIIVGVVLTNHFLGPVMAIEDGILRVLNGEYKYRFDVKSSEVGGLSYRINQLIGVLTGEEEQDEQA